MSEKKWKKIKIKQIKCNNLEAKRFPHEPFSYFRMQKPFSLHSVLLFSFRACCLQNLIHGIFNRWHAQHIEAFQLTICIISFIFHFQLIILQHKKKSENTVKLVQYWPVDKLFFFSIFFWLSTINNQYQFTLHILTCSAACGRFWKNK